MKEFRTLQTCSVCGEGFDSEYKLLKHMSKSHPTPAKSGWIGGEEDSCSCGNHAHYQDS